MHERALGFDHMPVASGKTCYAPRPLAFCDMTPVRSKSNGFSLIEMAVALFVIVLLLGSLLVPLSTQVDKRRYAETEKQMEHIREALIGYALINRHLPCPAKSASDGSEDRTGFVCNKRHGFIPWVTLGISAVDAWDNLIRYSVTPEFAISDPNDYFALIDVGDINIQTRDGADAEIPLTNQEIPAVFISHGKNGLSATSSSGVARTLAISATNRDEEINALNPTQMFYRSYSEGTGIGGEYDDVVAWISLNQLFARMVSAGRLP